MIDPKKIELLPEQYTEFCRKFIEKVGPDLEQQREARQQSEADAKQRWMR